MRGADKRVKQFRVTKRAVVATPVALLLAVTGLFAAFQLRAAWQIGELERQLRRQAAVYGAAIDGKDGSIRALEDDVRRLSAHAEGMKAKLQDLYALEAKLQDFIERYEDPAGAGGDAEDGERESSDRGGAGETTGSSVADDAGADRIVAASSGAADSFDPDAGQAASRRATGRGVDAGVAASLEAVGLAAPPPPVSASAAEMIALLDADEPDFRKLSAMIDEMERSLAYSIELARIRKAEADAVPSGWPTLSRKLTSTFGYRKDPFTGRSAFHAGVDMAGRSGDPVYAAGDGTVEESAFDRSKGHYVVLRHRNGLRSVYMHLKKRTVKSGEAVKRGERIGQLGSTGRSTGPHLHFEIWKDGEEVNPLDYLRLVKED